MNSIKSKVAIITGSGTGIGHAIALKLANEEVKVVLCGRRLEMLQKTAQEINANGGAALVVQADISQEVDAQNVISTTLNTYGTIDILVNNAGIAGRGFIHEHDIDVWDRAMDVNLRGPFLMARAVLPTMREKKSGEIINIGSEQGLEYYKGTGAYSIAKHALVDLSELIQRENQSSGIRVNTICPGWTITEMTQNIRQLNHAKCIYPEDIADLVIFLVTLRPEIKLSRPIQISPMADPWERG